MFWLSDTTAILYCAEEIGQHYKQHTPNTNLFCLANPYQAIDVSVEEVASPPKAEALLHDSATDAAPLNGEKVISEKSRKRKRKRKGASSRDPHTDIRREETNKRHAEYAQLLVDAQQLFGRWIADSNEQISKEGDCHGKPHQAFHYPSADSQLVPGPTAETAQKAPACNADASDAHVEYFDLLALSELRSVVKPKIQYHDSGAVANLFDTLIENTNDAERVASAFNKQVLIPSRCRFLISDVTRLQPLLAGILHFQLFCLVVRSVCTTSICHL